MPTIFIQFQLCPGTQMHIADHEIIIQINLFNHDIKKIHKHVKVPNSQIWDLEVGMFHAFTGVEEANAQWPGH